MLSSPVDFYQQTSCTTLLIAINSQMLYNLYVLQLYNQHNTSGELVKRNKIFNFNTLFSSSKYCFILWCNSYNKKKINTHFRYSFIINFSHSHYHKERMYVLFIHMYIFLQKIQFKNSAPPHFTGNLYKTITHSISIQTKKKIIIIIQTHTLHTLLLRI